MPEIKHDIAIDAKRETIYQALTTPQGLKAWFTTQVEGNGQVGTDWILGFTDQPSFTWRVLATDPDRVAWLCIEGPGNSPGTEVEFLLKSTSENHTLLTIVHKGWERNDPKFDRCVDIWRNLMNHLQLHCEARMVEPTYH